MDPKKTDTVVIREIMDSIARIDYGEVVIVVHDSEVVQIETKIKKRFKKT
jgi:hypothetical protein